MSRSCTPFQSLPSLCLGLVLVGAMPTAAISAHSGPGQALSSAASPGIHRLLETEAFSVDAAELIRIAATIPVGARYSAIQLLEDNFISYDEAGRATAVYRYIFRLERESAIQGWGIVQAGWLPWLEERPIIRARVITPDGDEHLLDPTTIGEVQPNSESPEMFQDHKVLRGPLPKLQVGAIVEVEIRTRDHRPFSHSGIRRNIPLCWNAPVQCSRVLVELPASAPRKWSLQGLPEKQLKQSVVGKRLRLSVEQGLTLPMKAREPYQEWDQEPWPALTLATAPSWAAVAAEYGEIVEAQIRGTGLKTWVAEAIGEAKERTQVIDRILARLQKQVRYIGLEFGETAIVPRPPAETLRRGYGDCKDKSTLLVALLREAGIQAHVALLRAGEGRDFSPELPGLAAFNHAIVHVAGPSPLWIDPSASQARAGTLPLIDCGRKALVISKDTKETVLIPAVEMERNRQIETREVFLAEDGPGRVVDTTEAVGASEISLRGAFTGADPATLRENLKKYIKSTYQSEHLGRMDLTDPLDLHHPFRLVLEAQEIGIATTSATDARVILNPWSLVNTLNQYLQPGEKEPEDNQETGSAKDKVPARRTDLLLPHAWAAEMRWSIHVPKGYATETLPECKTLEFGPARLTTAWKAQENGNLEATFRFSCEKLRWTPKEVDAARTSLKAFGEEPSPILVCQQVGEAHLNAGRFKEALTEFRALVAAHPTSAAPLIRLSRAQLQAGLGDSARESLRRAITLEPSSEHAHRQLGWTLEHDVIGRRFALGWDRAGAAAELRKAMELAPGQRAARIDLAILLSCDESGAWCASNDMEEVVKLYQDQLHLGKDEKAQANLTEALARMGRMKEARDSAQAMEPSADRNGWIVAMDACAEGSAVAIQEARRTHQDPEVRRQAFQNASEVLMNLRRYPEAGLMANEGIGTSGEAAKLQSRALLCPRLKHYETVPIDTKTPSGAILAFAKGTLARDLSPERFFDLLSPAQRPELKDAEAVKKAWKTFHYLSPRNGDWRNRRLDEAFSTAEFGQDGSDHTGYRLTLPQSSPFPSTLFVSHHQGKYRLVAWGNQVSRLGREALWNVEHDNLEGACAWLDRAIGMVKQPTAQDPFLGHPVAHFWSTGKKGSLEEARLAAALLIFYADNHEPSRRVLEQALSTVREPAPRAAVLRCLLTQPSTAETMKRTDVLSRELLALFPDLPKATVTRAGWLKNAQRIDEALTLVSTALKTTPIQRNSSCRKHPCSIAKGAWRIVTKF